MPVKPGADSPPEVPGDGQPGAKRYGAPAAACAAQILTLLGTTGTPLGVPDLARELEVSKSLVYRVTRELEQAGLLHRRPDHRFWLAVGVLELGGAFAAQTDYLESTRAALRALADKTGETANIAVLRDADVFYAMKQEGRNSGVTISHVGARLPANCTALGKALLSRLTDEAVAELLDGNIQRLTSKSIVDIKRLLAELEEVRERGYASEFGETIIGRCCIAVPATIGGLGEAAAMSVAASSEGFNERVPELVEALLEAKTSAERETGGHGAMERSYLRPVHSTEAT